MTGGRGLGILLGLFALTRRRAEHGRSQNDTGPGNRLRIQEYGYTGSRMKATVELPDDLVVEAKKMAAGLRRPLRELVERALRAELRRERKRKAARVTIHWVTTPGGLPPGLDLSDREAMHDFLRGSR